MRVFKETADGVRKDVVEHANGDEIAEEKLVRNVSALLFTNGVENVEWIKVLVRGQMIKSHRFAAA